jgi:hypothetical protein
MGRCGTAGEASRDITLNKSLLTIPCFILVTAYAKIANVLRSGVPTRNGTSHGRRHSLFVIVQTGRTENHDERKRRLVVRSEGQTRKFEYNICAARADPEEDQEDTSVVEGRCRGNARCTRGAEHQSRQPIPMHGVFPLRHRRSLSSPWLLLSIPHTALLP